MLEQDSWLPQAKALALGESQRVAHDCGSGSTMVIEHQHDHYRAYCFRCNDSGYLPIQASLHEIVQARKARQQADAECVVLPPSPVVTDLTQWSSRARLWLYRAGFGPRDIARLGFYYHPPTGRVVLPVVQDGQVVYWTARAVEPDQQPKYLNPRAGADVIPTYGDGPAVVLTEDILSAAKVGKVTSAWSMLGTKCKPCIVAAAVRAGKPVLVWLDNDTAGRRGAVKTLRALRAAGVQAGRIMSSRDPKLYSTDEVRRMVDQAMQEL